MSLQNGNSIRFLHGHIIVAGFIVCRSGILVGGAEDTLQIGGIDKSVIRNPLTGEPYIPGSSLKGKLRSITEKIVTDTKGSPLRANRRGDNRDKVWRHECDDFSQAESCQLCRIFGAIGGGRNAENNNNYPGALLVRDSPLSNTDALLQDGLPITEIKMENAIDRLTSAAHPRTFERVPAGARFGFELVYRIETLKTAHENGNVSVDSDRVKTDIANLVSAMEILEKDGIGGNVSRGYGRIEFKVKTFQNSDIKGTAKSGFKDDNGKLLSDCKRKINAVALGKE
jgi:CRISPR-associated protein Csm3